MHPLVSGGCRAHVVSTAAFASAAITSADALCMSLSLSLSPPLSPSPQSKDLAREAFRQRAILTHPDMGGATCIMK